MQDKADSALRRALAQAAPEDTLSVVAELPATSEEEGGVSPAAFRTRREYREALIDKQRSRLSDVWSAAADRVRQTGAAVHGGSMSGVLLVKGTPAQIEEALNTSEISRATLDKSMSLVEPQRPVREQT